MSNFASARQAESSSIRILQVYPKSDYFTGAAIQMRELAVGLAHAGHDVVVVTRPSEEWTTLCQKERLVHYGVPMNSELDMASAWRLARILRAHRIQVVHAHKGRARTLIMMAGCVARAPVLVLNRGVSFSLGRAQRIGYTTRRVAAIVAVCESIKQALVRSGVPAGKISVIYSATDTTRFHPAVDGQKVRRELGVPDEDFVITQIGVRSWKGNGDVILAMTSVLAVAPRARLLIVGARNPESIHHLARLQGVGHRVSVVGYRDDIPNILAASDCCVDASYAGLGLTGTLREALAVGTPVVATDVEGNPELISHGITGLLVPPRRPAALARALLEVIENPKHARGMASEGQHRVEAQFSLKVKLRKTEALYRMLLAVDPSR